MKFHLVIILLIISISSCNFIGEKKIVGLESLTLFHVDSSCELHEISSTHPIGFEQLIVKSKYKWEYSGKHSGEDEKRKQINSPIVNERQLSANRDILLGGKVFSRGENLSEMIHWHGSGNGTGFRIDEEILRNSDLAKEPTLFTLTISTNDHLKHSQSTTLAFDSTMVTKIIDSKSIPCK